MHDFFGECVPRTWKLNIPTAALLPTPAVHSAALLGSAFENSEGALGTIVSRIIMIAVMNVRIAAVVLVVIVVVEATIVIVIVAGIIKV